MVPSDLSIIQKAVLERLARLPLASGARILDVPCGGGALTLALQGRGWAAMGGDLDRAAGARLGVAFAEVDLNRVLPWSDGSFEAVVCTEGIEHLENHYAFLREIRRILTPGGILILTTPNIVAVRSRVRFFASGFFGRDGRPLNEAAPHPLHHIGLATFPELRYELHVCGFQLAGVGSAHTKPISYAYGFYIPWMWLYTRLAFRKEKDAAQRHRNRKILASLFSPAVLFAESLLLTARKE